MSRVAIGWPLKRKFVSSVIVGVRTPEQVIDNMQAADWDLDEALWRQLEERTRPEEDYLTFFNRQNYERIFSAAEFHDEQLDLL